MIIIPLESKYKEEFSILYHMTGIKEAKQILESGQIFGTDNEKHANFSAIIKRPDIAKKKEVTLRFIWKGSQCTYFGDPFGNGVPECNELPKPVIFHIFSDSPPVNGECLKSKKYWQTNVYPDTDGLIFDGIEEVLIPLQPIPKKPSKLKFWKYEEEMKSYEFIVRKHCSVKKLRELASTKINQSFNVPAYNKQNQADA